MLAAGGHSASCKAELFVQTGEVGSLEDLGVMEGFCEVGTRLATLDNDFAGVVLKLWVPDTPLHVLVVSCRRCGEYGGLLTGDMMASSSLRLARNQCPIALFALHSFLKRRMTASPVWFGSSFKMCNTG